MSDLYRFEMRGTALDRSGYYYPNWDRQQRVTVVAENKQDAANKAATVLGDTGRGSNWTWTFRFDSITPEPSCKCSEVTP